MPQTLDESDAAGPEPALDVPSEATPAPMRMTDDERRRLVRRLDIQAHVTILVASVVILTLAAILSVPGSAREDRVILPVVGQALPPLCASKVVFGRECPGCGLTRCFISMAHGDVARAWLFNPAGIYFFALVAAQVPYRGWQLARLARGKEPYRDSRLYWFAYVLIGLMFGQWIYMTLFGRW